MRSAWHLFSTMDIRCNSLQGAARCVGAALRSPRHGQADPVPGPGRGHGGHVAQPVPGGRGGALSRCQGGPAPGADGWSKWCLGVRDVQGRNIQVFRVARALAPSVVFVEEVQRVWGKVSKGEGAALLKKPLAAAIRVCLITPLVDSQCVAQALQPGERVVVMGTCSQPQALSAAAVEALFDAWAVKRYVAPPCHPDRLQVAHLQKTLSVANLTLCHVHQLWQHTLGQRLAGQGAGGCIQPPCWSTLAHMSAGHSPASILQVCTVLR